jgi:hypothetical protein
MKKLYVNLYLYNKNIVAFLMCKKIKAEYVQMSINLKKVRLIAVKFHSL